MTTPAYNTPSSIIGRAYQQAGRIQPGDTPNGEQIVWGMMQLIGLINYIQTKGLKLWLNQTVDLTLVSGQSTYTFGPTGDVVMTRPMRVISADYVQGTTGNENRRPLTVLSWDDFMMLSQREQPGALNSYFGNKQQTYLSVFFWLVPDATAASDGYVQLLMQVQVENFINLTDTMNFPIEWGMYLEWGLADLLATGQPQAIMDRCAERAEVYRMALEDWDVEDAPTRFTPDSRFQQSSKFNR